MVIALCYCDESLGDAWRHYFSAASNVEITYGDICQIPCDAIVSPANSFGFMDGGLDRALSERFGWDLQDRLQTAIKARPLQELLIGETLTIPTGDTSIPWLISAPTMRVPMSVRTSVNAYLAMKAILLAALNHEQTPPIRKIAIPGLGSGIGKLAPELVAGQMFQAFKEVMLQDSDYPKNFAEAQKAHLRLNRSGLIYD